MKVFGITSKMFFLWAFCLAFLLSATAKLACAQAGNAAKLRLEPGTLSFGMVNVGEAKALSVKIVNRKSSAVTISRISQSTPQFSVPDIHLPFNVPPGRSMMLTIAFKPSAKGHIDDTILLLGDEVSAKLHVHGTGARTIQISESLLANPSRLAFGKVQTGSSKAEFVTLTNRAGRAIRISRIRVSGRGFSYTGLPIPVSFAAGESYTFKVMFSPDSPSSKSGYLSVISNAPNSLVRIALWGNGRSGGHLSLSPSAFSFGSVAVGTTKDLNATLTANGSSVKISSATSTSPEFSLAGISLPLIIAAGQHKSLSVRFTPQSSGAASGRIAFNSTAANSPTLESLSGDGIKRGQHAVNLVWRRSTSPAVAGYHVYRSERSGGPYVKLTSLPNSTTSYTDSSAQAGTIYYYATTTVNKHGKESHYSNRIRVAVPGT
jgi:Abnormal spindle-like microcephaly-assoc'd, ASPM-SPD-2-Hydin